MHAIVGRCSQVVVLPLPARPALCGGPGADRGRRCLGGVSEYVQRLKGHDMSKAAVHDLRRPRVHLHRRCALALLVSVVASVSALAVLPTPSSASATGWTASGFGIKWFSSAYTCIDVEGPPTLSGWLGHDRPSLWVSTAQVSWLGAAPFATGRWSCDGRMSTDTSIAPTAPACMSDAARAVRCMGATSGTRCTAQSTAGTGAA